MARLHRPLALGAVALAIGFWAAVSDHNSQLNSCSYGNMRACRQAKSLSVRQPDAYSPRTAGQLDKQLNSMNSYPAPHS